MKNIAIKLVLFAAICAIAKFVMAATTQPQALGLVTAIVENKTLAQIDAYAPTSTGQLVYCSDCTRSLLCVSSGTAAGAWTIGIATGVFVGGAIDHCQ